MIITTGRHIRIEIIDAIFERTAEAPGVVKLITKKGNLELPANQTDMSNFIEAYRRICMEDVAYRKLEDV